MRDRIYPLLLIFLFCPIAFAESENEIRQKILNGFYGEEYRLIGNKYSDDLKVLVEHFQKLSDNSIEKGVSSRLPRHLTELDRYGPMQTPESNADDKLKVWFQGYEYYKETGEITFKRVSSQKEDPHKSFASYLLDGETPPVGASEGPQDKHRFGFKKSTTCKECHGRHYNEWSTSIMRRSAFAGPSQAFVAYLDNLTSGNSTGDAGPVKQFCLSCHVPTAFESAMSRSPIQPGRNVLPMSLYSDNELDGVTCHTCHSAVGRDSRNNSAQGLVGDGIGNRSVRLIPSEDMQGNIEDPEFSEFHQGTNSKYIQSSEFCGSCHDVRLTRDDTFERTDHQVLENLYTEHKVDFREKTGSQISCQSCHMSSYPLTRPDVYVTTEVADASHLGTISPARKHTNHAFGGISTPLRQHARTGEIFSRNRDEFGYPEGSHERRRLMLRSALRLEMLPDTKLNKLENGEQELQLRLGVTNVGAGHRVPSGFSHEREIWVWVEVKDSQGQIVYRSGYTNPDDDENLEAEHIVLDPRSCERITEEHGEDHNQRPEKNLGLVDFRNRFYRLKDGRRDNGDRQLDEYDEVTCANMADHINNTNSIAPQETRLAAYDIPIAENLKGPFTIHAKVRARPYTPHFLRFLVESERILSRDRPNQLRAMKEADLKRNIIVDMTELEISIPGGQ